MWRECEWKQAKSCHTAKAWELAALVPGGFHAGYRALSSPELISFLTLEKENLNDINHNMLFYFKVLNRYVTSRKGDEDRNWKHSTSSCSRQKPLSRLIFKRRTDAANRELDGNQRWLTGQGHFRGQSDFNRGRCPSGPTPRSAPDFYHLSLSFLHSVPFYI